MKIDLTFILSYTIIKKKYLMEKQIFIDGIETNYTVTNDGVFKNSKTGRIMTINNGNVQLYINRKGTGRSVRK
jgi:hypothetical protein